MAQPAQKEGIFAYEGHNIRVRLATRSAPRADTSPGAARLAGRVIPADTEARASTRRDSPELAPLNVWPTAHEDSKEGCFNAVETRFEDHGQGSRGVPRIRPCKSGTGWGGCDGLAGRGRT